MLAGVLKELAADTECAPRRPTLTKIDSLPEWVTIDEVAEHLRLSRSKLYATAQNQEIPCSKIAGRWRFFRPEIDAWMLSQRIDDTERSGGGSR